LAFDTVHACASITDGGSDTYTLTTGHADDLLTVQLTQTGEGAVTATLTGPDGTDTGCQITGWFGPAECPTGAAGTYTLVVSDAYDTSGYSLSASSLQSSPCTTLTAAQLPFGAPALTGSLAAGGASACYAPAGGGSGDLLRVGGLPDGLRATVYDAHSTDVCYLQPGQDTCAVTGTGPYRVILRDLYAEAVTYEVNLNRVSYPAGCTTLAAAPFGDPGQAVVSGTLPVGGAECRSVTLPDGPARVSLQGGGSTNGSAAWTLYTSDGQQVCAGRDDVTCDSLPGAGTYTLLLENTSPFDAADYTAAVIPLTGTDGCAASVGTSYDLPLLHRTLTSPVQVDCQPFSGSAGDRIDLTGQLITTIVGPAGTAGCSRDTDDGSTQDGCVLTGTGPYRAISYGEYDQTGPYTMRIARLSDPAGCTPLTPQVYGTTPVSSHNPCWLLQVPAAGTYDVGGTQVYHQDGTRFCADGAESCAFPAAGTYAMVFRPDFLDDTPFVPVFVGAGTADTYHLVRRDVSSTATCAVPASLAIGGQSTDYSFTSALDSRCLRVQAPATDKLWLSVRTPDAAANSGAELLVVDSTGTIVCWQQGASCRVTGSASYVAIVLAAGYAGTPIAAHVDTWRIGTAAGWVPQCTANSLSPDGFGPRSGSLTQSSAAFCGVMQVKPGQFFDIYGTESDPVTQPALGIYSNAGWNGTGLDYPYQCAGVGTFHFECSVSGNAAATQVVFVLSPGNTRLPVRYAVQGVCRSQCSTGPKAADVTSVSPASGPADGRNKVVIHGSNLTLGTEVDLAQNADRPADNPMSTPVSVSADGTSLTVLLNTYEVPVGTYDVVLDLAGYSTGTRSPGYLPGGYTVTAPNPPSKGGGFGAHHRPRVGRRAPAEGLITADHKGHGRSRRRPRLHRRGRRRRFPVGPGAGLGRGGGR
jgi:hypothetical protein